MKPTLAIAALALVASSAAALADDPYATSGPVDWKWYGGLVQGKETIECFYDAKGIIHQPDTHIRVWTKCLLQKDLDGVDIQKDFGGAILNNTARKVANYYIPPIALVQRNVDVNQAMTITQYEETADIAYINPVSTIFYELNCSDRMERELSLTVKVKGKTSSHDTPLDWKYIPPEGNAATLLQILCPAQ
jgi:hypothetical protein